MGKNYKGLRVWPVSNPRIYQGPRQDRQGTPVATGTVVGTNGMGAFHIRWDDGFTPDVPYTPDTLIPCNEVETYGQYVSA